MSQLYKEYDVLKVLLDTYSDLEDNNRNEFVKRFSELSIAYCYSSAGIIVCDTGSSTNFGPNVNAWCKVRAFGRVGTPAP